MPLKNRWCLEVTMATCWHVEYVSFVLKKCIFFQFFVFPIICIVLNTNVGQDTEQEQVNT